MCFVFLSTDSIEEKKIEFGSNLGTLFYVQEKKKKNTKNLILETFVFPLLGVKCKRKKKISSFSFRRPTNKKTKK